MMLFGLTSLFQVGAAVLTWIVMRWRPSHRPLAIFLGFAVAANVIKSSLDAWIPWPTNPFTGPLTGTIRLAFHVQQALFLAWPAALAALALWVFLRRRPWIILATWAFAAGALAASYPRLRGLALQPVYLAAELAGVLAALGFLVMWRWKGGRPQLVHTITMLVIGIDLGSLLFGPWRGNVFTAWPLAQVMYAVMYAAIILLQGGSLWLSTSSSRSG